MPSPAVEAPEDFGDLVTNLPAPAVPMAEDPRDLIKRLPSRPGSMSDLEMQLLQGAENMSPEDKETLESMLQKQSKYQAPLVTDSHKN